MKKFIREKSELSQYVELTSNTVYDEDSRPAGKVRVWLSYDIDKERRDEIQNEFYSWLDSLNAEAWGNSIATFTWRIECEPTNELVARWIVDEMLKREKPLLIGKDFNSMEWEKTPHMSLYVYYRYSYFDEKQNNTRHNSNYFVLLHNAVLPHLGGYTTAKKKEYEKRKEQQKRK